MLCKDRTYIDVKVVEIVEVVNTAYRAKRPELVEGFTKIKKSPTPLDTEKWSSVNVPASC